MPFYRSHFRLTLLAFLLLGCFAGFWQVLIADLAASLSINKGELGLALTVGVIGSLPAVFLGGKLIDRFGTNLFVPASALLMGIGLFAVSVTHSYFWLFPALILFDSACSLYCVAINAVAMRVEQDGGKPIQSYFHAGFSGMAGVGAITAGLLLQADMPFRALYAVPAACLILFALTLFGRKRFPGRKEVEVIDLTQPIKPKSLFFDRMIWVFSLLLITALVSESTLENWSVIYLRTVTDLPIWLGAFGVAIFHSAMFIGRMTSGKILTRLPRRRYLIFAGFLAMSGMSLALATLHPPLILIGFFLVGLAFSGVVPVAYSLAGDHAGERVGEASSIMTFIGNSGFLVAPGLVGLLAEEFSLRLALGIIILCSSVVALLGWRLRHQHTHPAA